jgi:hypothetical protein
MKYVLPLLLAPSLLLAGCDGPNEKAGREKDKAAAAAAGIPYKGNGPNEELGEAQDRAIDAARDAREATASVLQEQAHTVKVEADVAADRLEQQAEEIREQAKRRAAPLEDQAKSVRAQQ